MKLSIIIPVYNVENYIEECVRSLMEQTIKDDVEFVFINDATPDKSMTILKNVLNDYPQRKGQVFIYENEHNLGIAMTRKKAVHLTTGDYIAWCDSDGYCADTMYARMFDKVTKENLDICICNYISEKEDGSSYENHYVAVESPLQTLESAGVLKSFPHQLWATVMRRSLLIEAFDRIAPCNSAEDVFATILIMKRAESIGYVNNILYHHRILSTSITQNIDHSRSQWEYTYKNIKLIEKELKGCRKHQGTVVFWKKNRKHEYRTAFTSIWEFYWTFRELNLNILDNSNDPLIIKFKIFIINNFFPLYWWFFRKTWNR